jgi:hypothetical protein
LCRQFDTEGFARYDDNFNFAAVASWTTQNKLVPYGAPSAGNLFSFDLLLVPVHMNQHWWLLVADVKARQILVMDSAQQYTPQSRRTEIATALRQFLAEYAAHAKARHALPVTGWTIV